MPLGDNPDFQNIEDESVAEKLARLESRTSRLRHTLDELVGVLKDKGVFKPWMDFNDGYRRPPSLPTAVDRRSGLDKRIATFEVQAGTERRIKERRRFIFP